MQVSVSLPSFATDAGNLAPDIAAFARHAEDAGLDGVWVGDHLSTGAPFIESVVALGAAAAVTQRVQLGFGVMLLALRQQAWAAKQIASLQFISGNRVVLGVGVGVGGALVPEWEAAGVPLRGRGARTDMMLDALPELLSGRSTVLRTESGAPTVALQPAAPMPPVWIGGTSTAALRRTVEHGSGWLASLRTPAEVAECAAELAGLSEECGQPRPEIGTTLFTGLETAERERTVDWLASLVVPRELAASMVIGSVPELEDKMQQYARAGVSHFVVNPGTGDVLTQYDLIADVRETFLSEATRDDTAAGPLPGLFHSTRKMGG